MPEHKSKWEVFRDDLGEYRFRLIAGNGEIVLQSEGYTTQQSAEDTVVRICEIVRDQFITVLQSDPKQIIELVKPTE